MTMRKPADASTTLQNLLDKAANLSQEAEKLRNEKSPGTVVFFDLVGSTDYRRRHGNEKGLQKAFVHNSIVSRAVKNYGGQVVKWMGDGVMGCFTHENCGDNHPMRALDAALAGLKLLKEENCNIADLDDELHSKVSMSSGYFHFLNVGGQFESDDAIGAVLDPMGAEVDLAARMNGLCEMDVILVDHETFWGRSSDESSDEAVPIKPICKRDRDLIPWRELILEKVRETLYLPTTAGFFIEDDGLDMCRVGRGATNSVMAKQFYDDVNADAGVNGNAKRFLFCSRPVPCNIRGISNTVDVVAITTSPQPRPIKEQVYDWRPDEIKDLEARAEQDFRQGKTEEAKEKYEAVLELDSRQFQANTRVAMILRARKDTVRAMEHLMAAKLSNPRCPLVWGLAGITHLEDFIRDRGDKNDCLSRAVTGLSKARDLAEEQFHGLLEQYSTALLAIVLLLRATSEDKVLAKALIDKLELWPSKNGTVTILKRLASSFQSLLGDGSGSEAAVKAMEEIAKDFDAGNLVPEEEAATAVPYDHLVSKNDIHNLVAKAKFLMALS